MGGRGAAPAAGATTTPPPPTTGGGGVTSSARPPPQNTLFISVSNTPLQSPTLPTPFTIPHISPYVLKGAA
ncbi:hypothetical protein [Helicobacter bilis]|uniref:hypothetical protein n=1 Tax=Helicobacter bilis TaxID=37372 RepID=UPI0026EEF31E|nr:hypothetical protein [Helicobacter bilis]